MFLYVCPRSILAIRPRSLSSLYILVSSSLQGRLSSLLLISLRPSFYPCFRPRYKDASRPSVLTSNCFRPIPTHIFFHEQYTQPKADLRWHRSIRGSKTKCMRPRSYVTQGHVRVRPRRYVSPRTLALPPSD